MAASLQSCSASIIRCQFATYVSFDVYYFYSHSYRVTHFNLHIITNDVTLVFTRSHTRLYDEGSPKHKILPAANINFEVKRFSL